MSVRRILTGNLVLAQLKIQNSELKTPIVIFFFSKDKRIIFCCIFVPNFVLSSCLREGGDKKEQKVAYKIFRIVKAVIKTFLYILIFILLLLMLPVVQTKLATWVMDRINKDYKVNMHVERVSISLTGMVGLDGVLIRDHHQDTLIAARQIRTPLLDLKAVMEGNLIFSTIDADGLVMDMKTYKGDTLSNLDVFVASFDSGEPSSPEPFIMRANTIRLKNSYFRVCDFNTTAQESPILVEVEGIGGIISDFEIVDSDVKLQMKHGEFLYDKHLKVDDLSTNFHYADTLISIDKTLLKTPFSTIDADLSFAPYKESYADFLNKVTIKATLRNSQISTNDLNGFYDGFAMEKNLEVEGELSGTLNNLSIRDIHLYHESTSIEAENVLLKNAFSPEKDFVFWGDFPHFSSSYGDIVSLMPKVLGETLPEDLRYFGLFEGQAELTYTTRDLLIDADVFTQRGDFILSGSFYDLPHLTEATYKGKLDTYQLKVGEMLGVNDLGDISASLQFVGKGLNFSKLDKLSLHGQVHSALYNNYLYKDIKLDAEYFQKKIKATASIGDDNLQMDFKGMADITSSQRSNYTLAGKMKYIDLKALGFIQKDSIAKVKGNIDLDITGNSLDNMVGRVLLKNASYQKNDQTYNFADFAINIQKDTTSLRTITLESTDIISGKIQGEFKFAQIGQVLVNTLAYGFENYKPFKVMQGQYLTFDFKIYNKIIELFYPELSFAPNTFIRGKLVGDENDFKLNFRSPYINISDYSLRGVNLEYDKKNPTYRSLIQISSIQNPYYKIEEFNMLNTSVSDTLFFQTEFKGGKNSEDDYNLRFYHTINQRRESEVGIKPSSYILFKGNEWQIDKDRENKLVINRKLDSVQIRPISLRHGEESISVNGKLAKEDNYKDLHLVFEKVDVNKIIPTIDNLSVGGQLNGHLSLVQQKEKYYPTADLSLRQFMLNQYDLGNLQASIVGDENLSSFKTSLEFFNQLEEGLQLYGNIFLKDNKTYLDLQSYIAELNLAPFAPFAQDILSNLHGTLTGQAKVTGLLTKPNIEGDFAISRVGVGVPYLNIDLEADEVVRVGLKDNRFTIKEVALTDTAYKTKVYLSGGAGFRSLTDWYLDIHFDTKGKRFLALNTGPKDNDLFYGTGFIIGKASIKGTVDDLTIGVNAVTGDGTKFKIPLSDTQTVGDDSFITFVSKERRRKKQLVTKTYQGLEMHFEVDVLPSAEVEIIVDPKNNSSLIGRGAGTLLLEINTNGKFNMWGDFITTSGEYNFKYEGLIDKKFKVLPNGSISWNGDPMGATLQNLRAAYTLYVNPSVLLDSNLNRKIQTQVVVNLQGDLAHPQTVFDINFPDSSPSLVSELNYHLEDSDKKQLQAFSLLAQGNFMSDATAGEKMLSYNVLETATGIFNQLLSSDDDKLNLGVSYESGTATPNRAYNSSDRLGITVSTQITDRIFFNGKLGIPVGGVTQTAVAGDFELQFLLTRDGRLSAKIFNRENELQQYLLDKIDYSQGTGLTYKVDFDTFKELIRGIFSKAKSKE